MVLVYTAFLSGGGYLYLVGINKWLFVPIYAVIIVVCTYIRWEKQSLALLLIDDSDALHEIKIKSTPSENRI